MPIDRRQLSVQLDEEMATRFDRLLPHVSAALGIKLSQAQLVGLALKSLEKEYPFQGEPKRPPKQ